MDLLTYYRECERQELDVALGTTLGPGCCPECGRPDCRGGAECAAAIEEYARANADETEAIEAEMEAERCGI